MRISLIPARAGSKRLPGKNTRPLAGRPLISWTIDAALESNLFDRIVVCSDDFEVLALAQSPVICHQREPSSDEERDIDWLLPTLEALIHNNHKDSSVCAPCSLGSYCIPEVWLMRPTSPFRDARTLLRAHEQWEATKDRLDSMRAMRRATEHAFKQWIVEDELMCGCPDPVKVLNTMVPITTAAAKKHLHSMPTQSLTTAYIQTAGLEVFWARTILEKHSLAGDQVGMFLVEGPEAVDLNDERDWEEAERIASPILVEPAESRIRGEC